MAAKKSKKTTYGKARQVLCGHCSVSIPETEMPVIFLKGMVLCRSIQNVRASINILNLNGVGSQNSRVVSAIPKLGAPALKSVSELAKLKH
jgi:hypothetical protein